MRDWLRHGVEAAGVAGGRADLWPAGALAALVFAGWPVLLLVVAQPDPNDLAPFGVSIVTSGSFPYNAIALAVAVVAGFALLCLLAGLAEVVLLRTAAPARPDAEPVSRSTLTAFAIVLLSTLPAVGAAAALAMGLIAVAPGEFQSPDVDTPILLRLAGELWPFAVALPLAMLLGQAFGGVALRRALAPGGRIVPALAGAARDLVRRPVRRLGVAAVGLLADIGMAVVSYALLRVLWAPITADLAGGRMIGPETLLLLVGFVAIWLALLLAAGALHVAISAWWALELARPGPASRGTSVEARLGA